MADGTEDASQEHNDLFYQSEPLPQVNKRYYSREERLRLYPERRDNKKLERRIKIIRRIMYINLLVLFIIIFFFIPAVRQAKAQATIANCAFELKLYPTPEENLLRMTLIVIGMENEKEESAQTVITSRFRYGNQWLDKEDLSPLSGRQRFIRVEFPLLDDVDKVEVNISYANQQVTLSAIAPRQ